MYRWRIRCLTEGTDVEAVRANAPTTCPNDEEHEVDADSVVIVCEQPMGEKCGRVLAESFEGEPAEAAVEFATPYPCDDYVVLLSAETDNGVQYPLSYNSRTNAGFVVTIGSDVLDDLIGVAWRTAPIGE